MLLLIYMCVCARVCLNFIYYTIQGMILYKQLCDRNY